MILPSSLILILLVGLNIFVSSFNLPFVFLNFFMLVLMLLFIVLMVGIVLLRSLFFSYPFPIFSFLFPFPLSLSLSSPLPYFFSPNSHSYPFSLLSLRSTIYLSSLLSRIFPLPSPTPSFLPSCTFSHPFLLPYRFFPFLIPCFPLFPAFSLPCLYLPFPLPRLLPPPSPLSLLSSLFFSPPL